MSEFQNDLLKLYNTNPENKVESPHRAGDIIKVSPAIFGIRGNASSVTVIIVEVYTNGNLGVKTPEGNTIKIATPSQVRAE